MSNPLWTPGKSRSDQSTLTAFSTWLASRTGKSLRSFEDLHRFSITAVAQFWSGLWDFADVRGDKGQPPYVIDADRLPGARFFPAGCLNFAENMLRGRGEATALVFWGEDKVKRRLSHHE